MKKLNLFFLSFSQNVFSSLVLIIILSVALVSVQDILGQYRYITYSRYIIENDTLSNSDLFMIDMEMAMNASAQDPGMMYEVGKPIRKKILSFDGVEGIADSRNFSCGYISAETGKKTYPGAKIYTGQMQKAFAKQLTEGRWFEQADASSDKPCVVVCGSTFDNVSVGSDITITPDDYPGGSSGVKKTTVHVIGKVGYPWYAGSYGSISDDISTDFFLKQQECVIFADNEQTQELFEDDSDDLQLSYFVVYKDDCTDEQRNEVRNYIGTVGTYATHDTILENTNKKIQEELMNRIITPIFLLVIATIALISISTLNTYKKLKDHSVYYLCGCSRKKSFAYLFVEISIVTLIAVAVNIIYVTIIMNKLASGSLDYANCIVDYKNILFAVVYCLAAITVTTILPFIVYKKNTPLEVYRRNHND